VDAFRAIARGLDDAMLVMCQLHRCSGVCRAKIAWRTVKLGTAPVVVASGRRSRARFREISLERAQPSGYQKRIIQQLGEKSISSAYFSN
jgi:hypothetical protein